MQETMNIFKSLSRSEKRYLKKSLSLLQTSHWQSHVNKSNAQLQDQIREWKHTKHPLNRNDSSLRYSPAQI